MNTTDKTALILQELYRDISNEATDILSEDSREHIESILQKMGFDKEEQSRWIDILLKYWLSKTLIRLCEVLDSQEISKIKTIYDTSGQDGVNEYMKNLKNTDRSLHNNVAEVFQQEFLGAIKHFFTITMARS